MLDNVANYLTATKNHLSVVELDRPATAIDVCAVSSPNRQARRERPPIKRHPTEDCDQTEHPGEGCPTHRVIMRPPATPSTDASGALSVRPVVCPISRRCSSLLETKNPASRPISTHRPGCEARDPNRHRASLIPLVSSIDARSAYEALLPSHPLADRQVSNGIGETWMKGARHSSSISRLPAPRQNPWRNGGRAGLPVHPRAVAFGPRCPRLQSRGQSRC